MSTKLRENAEKALSLQDVLRNIRIYDERYKYK